MSMHEPWRPLAGYRTMHFRWATDLDAAIEAEAQARAICMQTKDFHRAFEAFAAKKTPKFGGN
jgi:enoyl-CoA hydratase/carnithine racemase